jgi:anion transporter
MRMRLSGISVFIIIAVLIAALKPFAPSLSSQGHLILAAVLFTVGLWIFGSRWIPSSVASMVMLVLILCAGVNYAIVFNGYTSRAIWILIPALFFGFALTKTGLGKRLAFLVMRFFKPSYLSLAVSWVIIGLVLSALTPSIAVRIAIVIPIAAATVEIFRIQYGSEGSGFVMLVAWSMAIIPGSGWLTGALWGPTAIGFFESTPGLAGIINFNTWFKAAFLPSELLALLFVLGLFLFMKPQQKLKISSDIYQAEYRALGPMSFREKATLTILLLTFLLLVTAQWHKIPDVAILVGAFALLTVIKVIEVKDIGPAISWDLVLFMGAIMGLGTIFYNTGIASFLSASFSPLLNTLATSPWLLLFVTLIGLFIWRFLDVSQLYATIPFLVPLLPVLFTEHGIHPLVLFMVFIMAGNCFFAAYQQPFVILGQSLAGPANWTPSQLRKAGIIYLVASLVTLGVSIPYWMMIGYIQR